MIRLHQACCGRNKHDGHQLNQEGRNFFDLINFEYARDQENEKKENSVNACRHGKGKKEAECFSGKRYGENDGKLPDDFQNECPPRIGIKRLYHYLEKSTTKLTAESCGYIIQNRKR